MTVRIKRHWYEDGRERSPEEKASVLAVAAWKSSRHALQGLRKARFGIDIGAPFIGVLSEFLVFLVTIADRMAYRHVVGGGEGRDEAWRQRFTVAMARRLAEMYSDNLDELIGPAQTSTGYAEGLIELLNRRMEEYAEFEYRADGPEFAFLRYFGTCVEAALPDLADRRWILDQVMATQAPEAIETVERGMRGVLGLDPKPVARREGVGKD